MIAQPRLTDAAPALPDVSFAELAFQLRLVARSEAITAAQMEHFIATLPAELTLTLRRLLADQKAHAARVGLCVKFCEAIAARETEVRALFAREGGLS
ncbi:MAG: hypothetical protein GEU91_14050 [Rhizobiales bacterium]|nr:hypothetical protein [Hyphomicrobiales bacterium]